MDIDRVRYFHIFAEVGSLVKASEVLHISQPALSKALRLLEYEVGSKLLEPNGRGLRLTAAGLSFRKETSELLQRWLQVPQKIGTGVSKAPTKIGSFEVFTTYFLATLTKHVDLEGLELHEFVPGKLEQGIADGLIDIGITYIPVPHSQVEFTEVAKIRMGVFGLSQYQSLSFADLPFVVPLPPIAGTPSKVLGLDGWPDHRFPRNIKYQVTMMESALELCRLGYCVGYFPMFIVDLHNLKILPEFRLGELSSRIPQKDRSQSVFLVHRKFAMESKIHRQIAKSLRSL